MTELISWFQIEYPDLVKQMKACDHHLTFGDTQKAERIVIGGYGSTPESLNPYHLESDVFTHVMLVCKQAENAPYTVKLAALLHDIGKPTARAINAKNGRVSFYNHDAVGAFMALEILKRPELNLTKEQQIGIFNTIALHTQIFKQTPEQLRKLFTNEQYWAHRFVELGRADTEGRFYSIPSETKTEYFTVEQKEPSKAEKEVVILCGIPGSGKSTWVENHGGFTEVISRDNCLMDLAHQHFQAKEFTYNEAWETIDQKKVDELLQKRFRGPFLGDVIVDMTHMSKKSRRKSLSHFGPEYKKKCVVFLTDLQTNSLRNENRKGKVINKAIIDRMMRSFYPPTYKEFDEIEYIL